MAVSYRLLHPNEEDAAVHLWMRVLDIDKEEARQTFRDFHNSPQRFDQTHVAVADDGQLLATVCYWVRDVRDIAGAAVRIGHLFHVATEPTARRHGHATRLLADTINALRAAGCQWAILSARQDAVGLYTRAGWQPTPRTYWRGTYAPDSEHNAQCYQVQAYDPQRDATGWEQLAAAYARANARQSGSLIRTSAYWQGYAAWMFRLYLDAYGALLLTVRDDTVREPIRGYALVNFYDVGFVVSEIANDPNDSKVVRSLLNEIITEARRRSIPLQGQLTIAVDSTTRAILEQFFGPTLHSVDDMALHGYAPFMVRPISDGNASPFTSRDALFWPLDAY